MTPWSSSLFEADADLHRETLTVHVVQVADEPDDDGVAAETSVPREWGPCNVQQVSSSEERGGREIVTTGMRASGPLARWISAGDRLTRDGVDYRVDGDPAHFVGNALDHTEVRLVAWKGV